MRSSAVTRACVVAVALVVLPASGFAERIPDRDKYPWSAKRKDARSLAVRMGWFDGASKEFTDTDWAKVELRLVKEWFPRGTPLETYVNYFSHRGFDVRFITRGKGGKKAKNSEKVLKGEKEHFVRMWLRVEEKPWLKTVIGEIIAILVGSGEVIRTIDFRYDAYDPLRKIIGYRVSVYRRGYYI